MRTKAFSRCLGGSAKRLSLEHLEDRSLLAAYTLTDLGSFGTSGTAQAYDINEAGQVVGYGYTAALKQHGFLWTDGVMTDLGTLPTGSSSQAFGLNNAGQVVGYAANGLPGGGGANHGFLWENGVISDITPGPESGSANAVNDLGQVVGNHDFDRVFLWDDGVITDLGGLAAGGTSGGYAFDINNAAQVVGSSDAGHVSEGIGQHAFLWEEGVMTDLGVLPGMEDSRAHAINELGQIVGFSSFHDAETTDEISRSFLYWDGVMTDLGVPGTYSSAEDINDFGQIVGWMVTGNARAYVYEDGVATDLNTLIAPGSGITLTAATGINNAGEIVGYGFGGGTFRAVLLTPVAPEENADFDGDDDVDGLDFLAWQRNAGTIGGASHSDGDANGDGVVDAADLGIWESQYGTDPPSAGVTSIPEPGTLALGTVALAAAFAVPRRRTVVMGGSPVTPK